MLAAHLVPGYLATTISRPHWRDDWSRAQRAGLWAAGLGSTVVPDLDVIYNWLFRGFFGHTILWTHSIFTHLGIVMCWYFLRRTDRLPYARMLVGLIALGGLSHLALDIISHGTPLFYPFTWTLVGSPSPRVFAGRVLGYLTDPIFLLEPLLFTLAGAYWVIRGNPAPRVMIRALLGLAAALIVFAGTFLLLLPKMQSVVVIAGPPYSPHSVSTTVGKRVGGPAFKHAKTVDEVIRRNVRPEIVVGGSSLSLPHIGSPPSSALFTSSSSTRS